LQKSFDPGNKAFQLIVMHPMTGIGKGFYLKGAAEAFGAAVGDGVRGP
jgi:hypothetical protein